MTITAKYCNAEDVRTQIGAKSKDDNGIIESIIGAVSRMIDGYMGYQDIGFKALTTATIREYATTATKHAWIDPCIEITSVKMKSAITDTTYSITLTVGTHVRGFSGSPNSRFTNFNKLPYHGIILLPNASRRLFLQGNFSDNSGFSIHPDDVGSAYLPTIEVTAKWGYAETVPDPIKQACIMQSIRVYKRVQGGMADALLNADFGQSRFLSKMDKDVKVLLDMSGLRRPKFVGR